MMLISALAFLTFLNVKHTELTTDGDAEHAHVLSRSTAR